MGKRLERVIHADNHLLQVRARPYELYRLLDVNKSIGAH